MALQGKNILAIDDTAPIRTFLGISLQAQGAQFHEAATAGDGLALCKAVKPDIVVLDLGLPDRDGLDILAELKSCVPEKTPRVIVLSVRKEQSVKERAFALGADAYLTKPFLVGELIEALQAQLSS